MVPLALERNFFPRCFPATFPPSRTTSFLNLSTGKQLQYQSHFFQVYFTSFWNVNNSYLSVTPYNWLILSCAWSIDPKVIVMGWMFPNPCVPCPGSVGVQKWGLREVSGFRWGPACGWGTVGGISALSRRKQESLALPHPHPPCEHTPRRHHLEARNRILTRNQVYSTFILDFSASRTVRIEYLLFKSPSLWVAEAQAEWTGSEWNLWSVFQKWPKPFPTFTL